METVDKNQTIDETKRKLKVSREKLATELELKLQDIKKDAKDFGKQTLLIGGGIYLSWKLIKKIAGSKKKNKKYYYKGKPPKLGFGRMLANQLMTVAIAAVTAEIKKSFDKKPVNGR